MSRFNYISNDSIEFINRENFALDNHKSNHWEILKTLSVKTGETIDDIVTQSFNGLDKGLAAKRINFIPFSGSVRYAETNILVDMINHLKIKSSVLYVARFCGYRIHTKQLDQLLKGN